MTDEPEIPVVQVWPPDAQKRAWVIAVGRDARFAGFPPELIDAHLASLMVEAEALRCLAEGPVHRIRIK